MASINAISGRLAFRTDTGEMDEDKRLYRTVSLGRVNGAADAEALGRVAGSLKGLLELPTDRITLSRTDEIVL
ncbi:MAG: hypothetical protein LBL73_06645 [Synergistaceae bacterium]|jgi:hypothetical protein|nr:hypothetical protein [Synergistaceae bacterium]